MLVYEVNLTVKDEVKVQFAGWLPEHIHKMIGIKGFKAAYWFFRRPEDEGHEPATDILWTIQYIVEDRASIDSYLANQAAAMRQEAIDKFGDRFKAERRILNLLSVAGLPFDSSESDRGSWQAG